MTRSAGIRISLLALVLALGGCGGGGSSAPLITTSALVAGFLPTDAMGTATEVPFLIRNTAFPQQSGHVTVHFEARTGTPFLGGTTATFSAPAVLELPNQMRGIIPRLAIPHTQAGEVVAEVRVEFADGSLLGGAPMTARFEPLPPPPPPRVIGFRAALVLTGTPTCFTVLGTDFDRAPGPASVEFTASAGTPFQGGTSATLTVPATIVSATEVRGVVPAGAVTSDATAGVTVHLPSGDSPSSNPGIVSFGVERKLVAPDAVAYDYLGTSVALSGDTAVVGARLHDALGDKAGAAYVFVREGNAWVFKQKLTAPDGGEDDEFGTAVAIDGDTIAIGAPFEDEAASNGGSVYVFTRTGATWSFQQKLMAADAASGDHVGESVAIHGDVVAAGAPDENNAAGTDAGSVYVFRRSGSTWGPPAKVWTGAVGAGDNFGQAVAVGPGTLVVGAPDADLAFAYAFDGAAWGDEQPLAAPATMAGDDFGQSVDVSGDRAIVGAPLADGAGAGTGGAHVFLRTAGTWGHEALLVGSGGGPGDEFGWSVAIDGSYALVGALDADLVASNAGAAYPFERTGPGTWTALPVLTAGDASSSDRFGQDVDLSECVAIVGSHLDNHAAGTDAGSAYIK